MANPKTSNSQMELSNASEELQKMRAAMEYAKMQEYTQALYQQKYTQYQNKIVGNLGLQKYAQEVALQEPIFETNLTQALVGWKCWKVSGDRIFSNHGTAIWVPDKPLTARCDHHPEAPVMHCGCGIYAADNDADPKAYGSVLGMVYGRGRYIRGDKGWRAQYAYPKYFLLQQGQENLIDVLRNYHVPIKAMQTVDVYHPKEDGYEYWYDQAPRNSGTNADTSAEED